MKTASSVYLIVLVLTLANVASAQELPPRGAHARTIDRLVADAGVAEDTPGVAVYVVQPGEWTFSKGWGLANVRDKTPITPQTRFELASLTKPFTALGIMILQERGKLSIDDDIRRHLPELPAYDPKRPIKVSDLLHHTSGLPDYLEVEFVPSDEKEFWANPDYLPEFAKRKETLSLTFATGERYEYSNTNYLLLASIIERASGRPYADFMRDEVFLPAGMTKTFVFDAPSAAPKGEALARCAIGYTQRSRGNWQMTWALPPHRKEKLLAYGDGGIWSSLDDLAKWDAALSAGKCVKPDTLKQMLVPSRTRDGKTNQYGLGFSLYPGAGGKLNGYGHDGSWGGFCTSYYVYKAANRTTIILSNRSDFDTDKFWYALNDAIEAAER